jgi:hypothetical protein
MLVLVLASRKSTLATSIDGGDERQTKRRRLWSEPILEMSSKTHDVTSLPNHVPTRGSEREASGGIAQGWMVAFDLTRT